MGAPGGEIRPAFPLLGKVPILAYSAGASPEAIVRQERKWLTNIKNIRSGNIAG